MKLKFFLLFLSISTHLICDQPIVAAYYENYSQYRPATGNRKPFSIDAIDPDLLTDLYYAFAGFGYVSKSVDPANPRLTDNFEIQPTEENDLSVLYPQIFNLKRKANQSLRIFLTLGGWNFNDPQDPQGNGQSTYRLFSQMVSTEKNRKEFIHSAMDYAHRYSFDGIDIDWEYPGDLTRGGTAEDFVNFVQFLKECNIAFKQTDPKLSLSYTAPAHIPQGLPQNYREDPATYFSWLAQCAEHLDRLNVMAYDYHTPFGASTITGANSPLNRDTDPKSPYFIAKTLENYLKSGIPANKIVLGLPAFGHTYAGVSDLNEVNPGPGTVFLTPGEPGPSTRQPGFLAYYEIVDQIKSKQLSSGTDPITNTAIAWNGPSRRWVSFDTSETIQLKVQLALEKKLRGIVLWAIDLDDYESEPTYPLLRSIKKTMAPRN